MTPVSLCTETIYNRATTSNNHKAPISMKSRTSPAKSKAEGASLQDIARAFVTARSEARALADFPGEVPADLDTAYRIQDSAIDLWPDSIGGWKVGRIPPDVEDRFGIDRLAGPIFTTTIRSAGSGSTLDMPVFAGGFAAVEAEYVAVIDRDAPADKRSWSAAEALAMIADLRIGLEIASSPLATINELGPAVVVSDFGNNAGLIIGPSIRDWSSRDLDTMRCRVLIDDIEAGEGGAFRLTGGFIRSVQFLLELAARGGRPLSAGSVIATGQTTGIHDVVADQTATLDFGNDGRLSCRIVDAAPISPG